MGKPNHGYNADLESHGLKVQLTEYCILCSVCFFRANQPTFGIISQTLEFSGVLKLTEAAVTIFLPMSHTHNGHFLFNTR